MLPNIFFADFENEARKLYSSFDALDPLMKTKLACEIIGTISGSVLLTYLTAGALGGAAGTAVIFQIKNALETALKLAKFSNIRKALAARKALLIDLENRTAENLYQVKRGIPKDAHLKNEGILKGLNDLPIKATSGKRKIGLNDDEIQQLYREIADHPVASISNVEKYSKFSPGAGYCWGRAMTTHIKALTNGLDKDSIRKVWALGELKTDTASWDYHVTTIVRDTKGKWHAIDPIMGEAMPIERWYEKMKPYDSTGDMRIFDTEAKRYGPGSPKKYNTKDLGMATFNGYFDDLLATFRKEASELTAQQRAAKDL